MVVGGKYKTLSLMMYQEVIGLLDFGKGCVIGLVLLFPAILAFLADRMQKNQSGISYVTVKREVRRRPIKDALGIVTVGAGLLFVLVPIFSFVVLTFVKKYPADMVFTLDNLAKAVRKGAGTLLLLIFVNITHFFSSTYLIAYNSLQKMTPNLEAVGKTLGIGRFAMIRDVFLPQNKSSILEMMSYFFVNSMITISAVSFLSNVTIMPVSLLISQFDSQVLTECSAAVSLVLILVNLVVKVLVSRIGKRNNL